MSVDSLSTLPRLRETVRSLVAAGAVITVRNSPCVDYLVGELWWPEGEQRLLLFAANGDRREDAHSIRFDRAAHEESGVTFFRGDKLVASLVPIDDADVPDREDYQVGWQIWQHVAPMRTAQIRDIFAEMEIQASRAPF